LLTIRPATSKDLGAITQIYNGAILNTTATFDTEIKSLEDRKNWFDGHGAAHPILVAEQDRTVIGWASLSAYSDRCAYSGTAEISLYVHKEYYRQGIGRKLTEMIIQAGRMAGLHTLIARIACDNEVSIRLAKSVGFESVGTMREVGRKFGRLLDVEILQLLYR